MTKIILTPKMQAIGALLIWVVAVVLGVIMEPKDQDK
jgi:hypothetical protein